MALPANIRTVKVTGTYHDSSDGSPLSGTVTFAPNVDMLTNETARTMLASGSRTVILDANGHFETTLIDTGDVDLAPTGWAYRVTESLCGERRRPWLMVIPDGVTTLDVAEAQGTQSAPALVTYVTRGEFQAHAGRHSASGLDPVTPSAIGAATAAHTHPATFTITADGDVLVISGSIG